MRVYPLALITGGVQEYSLSELYFGLNCVGVMENVTALLLELINCLGDQTFTRTCPLSES